MKKAELLDIITAVVMAYPERFKEESIPGLVTAWYAFFKDDDVRIVELAVTKHISVNKWPPNIAEIREQMINITRPDIIPPDVAWSVVSDLLYSKSEFEYFDLHKAFPPLVARVVETIGWNRLYNLHRGKYSSSPEGIARVAFMDLYKPAYEREREKAMLPPTIKGVCDKIQKECGEDSLRMIRQAHNERLEKELYWESIANDNLHKRIGVNEQKFLGGNDDE